ncbi:MAG: acetate--CoA ligase family protein, partial [Nitrospinaceae bacterium]|nr:acetate--CoA ligase family protein [Nitrospinaceae bacterium]
MTHRHNLRPLLEPKSIAVVGASSNLNRTGGRPIKLLLDYDFEGPIYPINPNRDEIGGLKSYPDIASLPETPELVLFCTPRENNAEAMRACAARGVGAAAVMSSGYAEVDEEGARLQEELLQIAREGGIRLLGPNCMGVVHVRPKLMASFTISIMEDDPLIPGSVALITQSGALGACLLTGFQASGTGISSLVSLGNESDVDFAECVEYFIDDPHTKVICGYMESVRASARLRAAAERALEAGKPIVLLKAGTTEEGARTAMSHTAALTTSHDVFSAFAEQYGVRICDSFDEILSTADFLCRSKPLKGRGLGILSFSGGACSLAADHAVRGGFELPGLAEATRGKLREILSDYAPVSNPVDLVSLMVSRPETKPLQSVGRAVFSDPNIDATLMIMGIYHHVADQIAEDMTALFKESPTPFACVWVTGPHAHIEALRRSGTPVFDDYPLAVRALEARRLIDEAAERAARGTPPIDPARQKEAIQLIEKATASTEGMLDTQTCTALLDLYGISRAEEHIAASMADAIAAWRDINGPVVLKVVSDALVHKTDVGGVVLNLNSEEEIREAAEHLLALAPGARILVQEMAAAGVELICGISKDPTFGP